MSNLVEHAKYELERAGFFKKNSIYGGMLGRSVLDLIKAFAKQGHSGMSANMAINLFERLAKYKPLVPLDFCDDEWNECGEGTFQNKRDSAVFKEGKNGRPYYIYAYSKVAVFQDGHKSRWSGILEVEGGKIVRRCYIKDSNKMPTVEIELATTEHSSDPADWDFTPAKKSQLDELRKYYDFDIEDINPEVKSRFRD